jgi:fibronectin type 3 domain-containing protein
LRLAPFGRLLLLLFSLFFCFSAAATTADPSIVSTFHSVGIHWETGPGSATEPACSVRYRVQGASTWTDGHDLWWDWRAAYDDDKFGFQPPDAAALSQSFRGSLVELQEGTTYEIELAVDGGETWSGTTTTRSSIWQIANRITLPTTINGTYVITQGGSAETGYVLYEPAGDSATVVGGVSNVRVQASYVIVRGLTLKDAEKSALLIEMNRHDVVVENCDISNWGTAGLPSEFVSAIYYNYHSSNISGIAGKRFVFQGNYIHDPANGAAVNSDYRGSIGIGIGQSGGENVIRWNTIHGTSEKRLWDGIGGAVNFTYYATVGSNSDVYGNDIAYCSDDCIEADGPGDNLRIWNNRVEHSLIGISVASAILGPTYIFRNVGGSLNPYDNFNTPAGFLKIKGYEVGAEVSGGRLFVYHNTAFVRPAPGISDGSRVALGWGADMINTHSRNNVFETVSAGNLVIKDDERNKVAGMDYTHEANDIDYDLYFGVLSIPVPPNIVGSNMTGSIRPVYEQNDYRLGAWASGNFRIAAGTPGHNDAVFLPGFNRGSAEEGGAPDRGVLERGSPNIPFGTLAYTEGSLPQAPTALSAIAQSAYRIYLTWEDTNAGEPNYTIERSVGGGAYQTLAANLIDTQFSDTGLAAGTNYSYRVLKLSGSGASAPSGIASVSTPATSNLEPVADLHVRSGTYSGVNHGLDPELWLGNESSADLDREIFLRFDVSGLASGQSAVLQLTPIEVGSDANAMTVDFDFVSNDSWTETGLVWNTKPTSSGTPIASITGGFQVGVPIEVDVTSLAQAQASGDGVLSLRISSLSEASGRSIVFAAAEMVTASHEYPVLVTSAPAAPTGLTATAGSASRVSLTWDSSATATSYNIKRSTSGGPYETVATGVTARSYLDTGLSESTAYSYVVTAVNAVGESGDSDVANIVTLVSVESGTVADAHVQSGPATENTNFGSEAGLWVKLEPDVTKNRVTFLRFDVAAMADAEVVSLLLMPTSVGAGTPTTLAFAFVEDDSWGESTVTWVNQPAGSGAPFASITDGFVAGTPVEIDVTALAKAEATGDGQLSIAIYSTASASNRFVIFGSRENSTEANRPFLVAALDSPIPSRVTGLTAVASSTSQIDLAWDPADRADSYTVKRSTGGGAYTGIATGVTSTSYADTGLAEFQSYTYVVAAVNTHGPSSNSAPATATTLPSSAPSAPAGVTATATGNTGAIEITWNANAITGSYTLKRSTTSGGSYATVASGLTGTTYQDTALTNGVTYYYVLSAENPLGSSPNSAQASATPFLAPPAPVSGLTATAGIEAVTLAWPAQPATDSYNIKRSTTSGGPYTTVATGVVGSSYKDTGLTNDTAYYYVIAGVNASGEGANSAEATATPREYLVLFFESFESPPETVNANPTRWGVSNTGIIVTNAAASEGTNSLFVRDGVNRRVTYNAAVDLTGAEAVEISFDFAQLSSTETGEGLIAFDLDFGLGFETVIRDEGAADGLVDGAYAGATLVLNNSNGTGAMPFTRYAVTIDSAYFADILGSSSVKLRFITQSSTGTESFRIDNIRVIAKKSAAPSALAAPTGLAAVAASPVQIDLSWNASVGAQSYNLKRATVPGGPYTTIASGLTATSYADTGLTAETAYYYVVSDTGIPGESPDSAEATATTLTNSVLFIDSFEAPPETVGATPTLWTVSNPGIVVNAAAAADRTNSLFVRDGPNRTVTMVTPVSLAGTEAIEISFDFAQLNSIETGEGLIAFAIDFGAGFQTVINDEGSANGLAATVYSGTTLSLDNSNGAGPVNFVNYKVLIDSAYYTDVLNSTSIRLRFVTHSGAAVESFRIDNVRIIAIDSIPGGGIDAPTGLTAVAVSESQLDLSWDAVIGAESYDVKRAAATGGPYTTIATGVTGTTYSDSSLTSETAYFYVVSAVATSGESPDSAEATATTLPDSLLFFDSFENPPETVGSVPTQWTVSNTAIVVNSAAASEGTNSLFVREGANRTVTLTTPIDLTGVSGIEISFDFAQLNSIETGEGLTTFAVDFGSGFETVITDEGAANGLVDGTYSGTTITLPNANGTGAMGFTNYKVTIDSAHFAGGNSVRLRFVTNSSASVESFRIDNVLVVALPGNPQPTITSATTASSTYGSLFNYAIQTANPATSFAATGLPAGLSVDPVTGVISGTPAAGGLFVVEVSATNTAGTATAQLTLDIAKLAASVTLSDLEFAYDGSPKSATVATTPSGLAVTVTYNGSTTAPIDAGSYEFVATVVDAAYAGAASGTFEIAPTGQTIDFPPPGSKIYGEPAFALSAVASSSLPVTYSVVSGPASVSGNEVTLTGTGSVTLRASQEGNSNFLAATPVDATFTVAQGSATVTFDRLALLQSYDGTARPVPVTTGPEGIAVTITYNGSPNAPIYPGVYEVVATVDDPNYEGSATATQFITITALVRHKPIINDNSGIEGSMQILSGELVLLNHYASISGDLLVPGQPNFQISSSSAYAGVIQGPGGPTPFDYTVRLNNHSLVRYIVNKIDPIAMPTATAPQSPSGHRNVLIFYQGQDAGDFSSLRNLTLLGSAGTVSVPPGTYGNFLAIGNATFQLGVPGSETPAVYDLQNLQLHAGSSVEIVGPVLLRLKNNLVLSWDSHIGSVPDWLTIELAGSDVIMAGSSMLNGHVIAPNGILMMSGGSELTGSVIVDRLFLSGEALLRGTAP